MDNLGAMTAQALRLMRRSVTNKSWPEMLPFTPHDHDQRVEHGGWVFFVRGVKKSEPLRGDATWDGSLGGFVLLILTIGLLHLWWKSQDTWKVGVLRYRSGRLGGRITVVHKELLPPRQGPTRRIAELVEEVERGRFDAR